MKIAEKRIEKGMTQIQLAELCGVSQQMISNIERGVRMPSLKCAEQLAIALECTIDELYGRTAKTG